MVSAKFYQLISPDCHRRFRRCLVMKFHGRNDSLERVFILFAISQYAEYAHNIILHRHYLLVVNC